MRNRQQKGRKEKGGEEKSTTEGPEMLIEIREDRRLECESKLNCFICLNIIATLPIEFFEHFIFYKYFQSYLLFSMNVIHLNKT